MDSCLLLAASAVSKKKGLSTRMVSTNAHSTTVVMSLRTPSLKNLKMDRRHISSCEIRWTHFRVFFSISLLVIHPAIGISSSPVSPDTKHGKAARKAPFNNDQQDKMNNSTWVTSTDSRMDHQDDHNTSMTILFFIVALFGVLIGCYFVSYLGIRQQIHPRRRSDHRDTVSPTCRAAGKELVETQLIVRKWKVSLHECPSTDSSSTDDIECGSASKDEPKSSGPGMSTAPKKPCPDMLWEEPSDGCAICLGPFNDQDRVCESNNTSCQHIFHAECMIVWLKKQNECPVCRQVFLLKEEPACS